MTNKFSMTITGVIVSVAGTILLKAGFTEACSNEIVTTLPVLIGGAISWVGRYRKGDITLGGLKKG